MSIRKLLLGLTVAAGAFGLLSATAPAPRANELVTLDCSQLAAMSRAVCEQTCPSEESSSCSVRCLVKFHREVRQCRLEESTERG